MDRTVYGKGRQRGATGLVLVVLACIACDTDASLSVDGRHDAGLDASLASGGANTGGSGGAGRSGGASGNGGVAQSGGAGGRAGNGGGSGNGSGGTAGLGGAGGMEAGAGARRDAGDAGDGDCSSAVDQGPCSKPGTSCGGPCTDVCSFCNILVCNGGRWQHMEVFPAPCFDCGTRRCQRGATFCSVIHAATDSFECLSVPTGCEQDVTCVCIQPKVSADTCTVAGQGEVTVERSGG